MSQSTMPAVVTLAGDGPFALADDEFSLDPGESRRVAVTGDSRDEVSARFAQSGAVAGHSSAVTLRVSFPEPAPWTPPWGAILAAAAGVLVALRGLIAARRVASRHQITRREA